MNPASRPRADGGVPPVSAGSPVLVVGAIALLLAAIGGGALLSLPDSTTTEAPREPLDGVPSEVDYVGYLDSDTYHENGDAELATRRGLRFQSLVQFYDGPPFRQSFAIRESALDRSAVRGVTYFGRHNSSYEARIVVGNWTATDLAGAVEADTNVTLEPTDVNGTTLYRGGGLAVARLGDESNSTVLVVGNETAVRDAMDVTAGSEDGVAGPLRTEFEEREGYVRYAYRFQPFRVPNYPFVGEAVESVEYVSSEYALNHSGGSQTTPSAASGPDTNTTVRVAVDITTTDSESARSVRTILNAGVTFYRVESGNETLRGELAKVEVPESQGRSASISYESSPRLLRVLIRGLFRNQPEPSGRLVGAEGVS